MALRLFQKKIIRIKNRVVIKNNNTKEDEQPEQVKPEPEPIQKILHQEVNAKIRGKFYGRRTIR